LAHGHTRTSPPEVSAAQAVDLAVDLEVAATPTWAVPEVHQA
jgi:hypothetical protein